MRHLDFEPPGLEQVLLGCLAYAAIVIVGLVIGLLIDAMGRLLRR